VSTPVNASVSIPVRTQRSPPLPEISLSFAEWSYRYIYIYIWLCPGNPPYILSSKVSFKFLCVLLSSYTFWQCSCILWYVPMRSYQVLIRSPLCFAMQCFFVIRSYTFLLSSYTFSRTFWSDVSNSDTFLYVLCDSHANSAKSTICYKFRSGFDGCGPPPGRSNKQQKGGRVAILCQISLSIKFPCVLLQVLMRSRLPCQFPDLWDSV